MEYEVVTIQPSTRIRKNQPRSKIKKLSPQSEELDFSTPLPCDEESPEYVEGTYKNDLNIIKIHEAIRAKFSYQLGTIDKLEQNIHKLNEVLSNSQLTYIDFEKIRIEKQSLEEKHKTIIDGSSWKNYCEKAEPLLKDYLPICSNGIKGIININVNADEKEDPNVVSKREKIIFSYLAVAEKYLNLNIHMETQIYVNCPNCGIKIDYIDETDEKGIHICECGYETIIMSKVTNYKDSSRIDVCNRNTYDDLTTFVKRMDAFEGRQDYNIPELLYIQLDNYFVSQGLPLASTIRELPHDENGQKKGTSIRLLEKGLFETKNAFYYKDMELIAHKLWGWKLGDLTNYRDQMIDDYKRTQEYYKEAKKEEAVLGIKERESSLNINMRLFWHLSGVGYPNVNKNNFKFVTSRDSLEYHSRVAKKMFEKTGIKFIPII